MSEFNGTCDFCGITESHRIIGPGTANARYGGTFEITEHGPLSASYHSYCSEECLIKGFADRQAALIRNLIKQRNDEMGKRRKRWWR